MSKAEKFFLKQFPDADMEDDYEFMFKMMEQFGEECRKEAIEDKNIANCLNCKNGMCTFFNAGESTCKGILTGGCKYHREIKE